MKQQENKWISNIKGKSISEKLELIERNPLIFSDSILKEYLNIDFYKLTITEEHKLSDQFIGLLKKLYQSSTSL